VPLDSARGVVRIALPNRATLDLSPMRGGSIEADLAERDFTVDAVAMPLTGDGDAVDPFRGLDDLAHRRLRLVSSHAFHDDGLRLLRAARLLADLDLAPDQTLLSRAAADAERIGDASPERQRDELVRLLAADGAARGLRLLDRIGVLERLLPEITAARGVSQPKEHHYDVFDHSIETVAALDRLLSHAAPPGRAAERLKADLWERLAPYVDLREYFDREPVAGRSVLALTKLGGLLHDVAKPETKAPDETGRIRFLGHPERGAERTPSILGRLRFSNRETAFVRTLVRYHLRPTQLSNGGPPTDRALARYFRDLDDAALALLILSLADHMAARGPRLDYMDYARHVAYIAYLLDRRRQMQAIAAPRRLLTGDDLIHELGIGEGPIVGRLLRAVEDAEAAGEVQTREDALALARAALDTAATSPDEGHSWK
jgi:poly(A) polymerase